MALTAADETEARPAAGFGTAVLACLERERDRWLLWLPVGTIWTSRSGSIPNVFST